MDVKIKKLNEKAVINQYAKPGDAGIDLVATSCHFDKYGNAVYGTGIAMEIPEGYVGLLFPRSSISKYDLAQCNCVGVIDSGYRGEIIFKYKSTAAFIIGKNEDSATYEDIDVALNGAHLYQIGDKIGQIIILPYPQINFVEVNKLSNTERGEAGFGSTGK